MIFVTFVTFVVVCGPLIGATADRWRSQQCICGGDRQRIRTLPLAKRELRGAYRTLTTKITKIVKDTRTTARGRP